MTTSMHTPGPWAIDMDFLVAPDPTGTHFDLYIAEIVREDTEGRVPPDDEQEANARLIAAAPELLSALQNLVCEAELGSPSGCRVAVLRRAREVVSAVLAA
jgi:hypothetical protein